MADPEVSAISLIQNAVEANLISVCQTVLESSDITRAFVVRSGLLQDDPTQKGGVNILIHPNKIDVSPQGWAHGLAVGIPGMTFQPYEIAGCAGMETMWVRKFIVEIKCFFPEKRGSISTTRTMARDASNVILSRCEKGVVNSAVPGIDDFGEKAMQYFLEDSWQSEAGGDGQWIWYNWIKFMCLTGRRL